MKASVFILALGLAACGSAGKSPAPRLVEIGTYLATPVPGQATRDAARRACRRYGQNATFVETRRDGGTGFRHIYRCGS